MPKAGLRREKALQPACSGRYLAHCERRRSASSAAHHRNIRFVLRSNPLHGKICNNFFQNCVQNVRQSIKKHCMTSHYAL